MLLILILSAALAYCAFRWGGVAPSDASLVSLVIACAAAACAWPGRRGSFAPPACRPVFWPLFVLTGYIFFQLIPLPMTVIQALSPARAALLRGADAVLGGQMPIAVPLSLTPALSLERTAQVIGCVLLLFLIRDLAWEHADRVWLVIAPLVAIAVAEAAIGWLQYLYLGSGETRGTWPNRNHFANFLSMCLPFPAAYAFAVSRRSREQKNRQLGPVALVCAALFTAAFLLVAIMRSLSRMGLASALFALLVCVTALGYARLRDVKASRQKRVALVAMLPLSAIAGLFVLAPPELIGRFTDLDFSDGLTTQDRVQLWKESLPLLSRYLLFGTGLGGYESAFVQFKMTSPFLRDEFAHNDYLQYLIELGLIGFVPAVVAAAAIIRTTCRALWASGPEERALAAACCGSFAAILLHSTVDFSLYVPANAFLLAWIAGRACALPVPGGSNVAVVFPPLRSGRRTATSGDMTRESRLPAR